MFLHLFINRLKCLLRDTGTIFWTLAFPLILSTLFYFSFGNLMNGEVAFEPVPLAVVDNDAYRADQALQTTLTELSEQNGENRLFALRVAAKEEAARLLEDGEVDAVAERTGNSFSLRFAGPGLSQSIVKSFFDQYLQITSSIETVAKENPAALEKLPETMNLEFLNHVALGNGATNAYVNFFYALVAMACMYGSFLSLRNSIDLQANLSPCGARRGMAPTHKLTAVLSDSAAALLIHLCEVGILLAFLAFVLGVDFADQAGWVLLSSFVGCVTGICFGAFVGAVGRWKESVKIGILISVTMLMTFLAGMMSVEVRYFVAQNLPVLSYINPAALITDAFYCLYLFGPNSRFFFDLGLLGVISAVLCAGSYFFLRRRKFASL